jgi:hypothetical protein
MKSGTFIKVVSRGVLLIAAMGVAHHAAAGPITWRFDGQIRPGFPGLLGPLFDAGDPASFTLTFESSTLDSCADPSCSPLWATLGIYDAVSSLTATFGGSVYTFTPGGGAEAEIRVRKSGTDEWELSTSGDGWTGPAGGDGFEPISFLVELQGNVVLASDALPLVPLDLTPCDPGTGINCGFTIFRDFALSFSDGVGAPIAVHSSIDSVIEVRESTAPEPGSFFLMGIGLGAALMRRARRIVSPGRRRG